MPATTTLLTLILVGGVGASPGGRVEVSTLDPPPDPPARVTEASVETGNEEGRIGAAEERDTSSAKARRTTIGGFTQHPVVRGALIGALLGAVIGVLGGAAVGGIMSGVVRSLP